MKVTFYTKDGELIQTLCGGTFEHISHKLKAQLFTPLVTYSQASQTVIYSKSSPIDDEHHGAVIAIIQPITDHLLPMHVLTKYLP